LKRRSICPRPQKEENNLSFRCEKDERGLGFQHSVELKESEKRLTSFSIAPRKDLMIGVLKGGRIEERVSGQGGKRGKIVIHHQR